MFNKIQLTVFTLLVFVYCVLIFPIHCDLSDFLSPRVSTVRERTRLHTPVRDFFASRMGHPDNCRMSDFDSCQSNRTHTDGLQNWKASQVVQDLLWHLTLSYMKCVYRRAGVRYVIATFSRMDSYPWCSAVPLLFILLP